MIPPIFLDRNLEGSRYPWFEWKARLFFVGGALALVGIASERDWIVAAATLILVAAFALRFLPGARRTEDTQAADDSSSPDPTE